MSGPSPYPRDYAPSVLVGIPRVEGRAALGLAADLPFSGVDVWHAHELSWLEPRGKPVVATAELRVPASSPNLLESKSLKLYLASWNGVRCASPGDVERTMAADLAQVVGSEPALRLTLAPAPGAAPAPLVAPPGACIDGLDVSIDAYDVRPELLEGAVEEGGDVEEVEETLHSHLLRTNCPVTGQPDWATLVVRYHGRRIHPAALLRYLVSYRSHAAFHEHCVERIFVDLRRYCAPRALTVFALYTRRGGIDINPFRSDFEGAPDGARAWRQ